MTQESKQGERRRILEMEEDGSGIGNLQASPDETVIKLTNAKIRPETPVRWCRQGKVPFDIVRVFDVKKCELEDLEALKELCGELEEDHIQTEKQLNEDFGASNFNLCQ